MVDRRASGVSSGRRSPIAFEIACGITAAAGLLIGLVRWAARHASPSGLA